MVVARARKVERFLSQPFDVAEVFTGSPGVLVDVNVVVDVDLDVDRGVERNTPT